LRDLVCESRRDATHPGEIVLMIDRSHQGRKSFSRRGYYQLQSPSLERYTLAGEVTGEKAKRTRYGERRWAFVVRGG
jgi:hypothetical protein